MSSTLMRWDPSTTRDGVLEVTIPLPGEGKEKVTIKPSEG